jgi:hypothetical protein
LLVGAVISKSNRQSIPRVRFTTNRLLMANFTKCSYMFIHASDYSSHMKYFMAIGKKIPPQTRDAPRPQNTPSISCTASPERRRQQTSPSSFRAPSSGEETARTLPSLAYLLIRPPRVIFPGLLRSDASPSPRRPDILRKDIGGAGRSPRRKHSLANQNTLERGRLSPPATRGRSPSNPDVALSLPPGGGTNRLNVELAHMLGARVYDHFICRFH